MSRISVDHGGSTGGARLTLAACPESRSHGRFTIGGGNQCGVDGRVAGAVQIHWAKAARRGTDGTWMVTHERSKAMSARLGVERTFQQDSFTFNYMISRVLT